MSQGTSRPCGYPSPPLKVLCKSGGKKKEQAKEEDQGRGQGPAPPCVLTSQTLTSPLLGSDPGAVGQHQEWVGHLKTQDQVLKASSKMPEASSEALGCEADPANTMQAQGV